MSNDQLFKELCRPEIIRIGWHLAQGDSRDDFVRDPVGYADYASNLSDRLFYLIEQVEAHRYRPRHLIEVDVPKSGLSVRPGNVLPIEEASILHSIIYLLSPKLDKKLSDSVYSYRLHQEWEKKAKKGESLFREIDIDLPFLKSRTIHSINPFEAWYERWPAFEKDAKDSVEKEGYTHLTKTDISSYFENIDLRLLHDLIRSLLKTEEEKILQLLFRIMSGWTRSSSAGMPITRGIPQGNDVSSFLGNIYLIPLDRALNKFCSSNGGRWFRYVDDVKVYTKSEKNAREAVFIINEALRQLHLNLQGSKTEILYGERFYQEHDTTKMDRVNDVFDNIKKLSLQKKSSGEISAELNKISGYCKPFTVGLPDSVRGLTGKENRLFRRLLATYGIAGRTRKGLSKAIFCAIAELPDLRILRRCLSYLTHLDYKTHSQSINELLSALEAGTLLFPYQIATVLEAMVLFHPLDAKGIGSRIRSYAFGSNLKKNNDWFVIQKALEALMSFPYQEKFIFRIALNYIKHQNTLVRRAAVALLTRAPKDKVRKHLRELTMHPDSEVLRLSQYLESICSDKDFSFTELAQIHKGRVQDNTIIKRLPQLYAASSTDNKKIAQKVFETITHLGRTKSSKLDFHYKEISARTKWSVDFSPS
ncbi:MAG: hypothetical protein HZC48_08000 [Nitrospirae bacterium]|nr:hypothetical protein [Nitrospirota bacterium]